MHSVTVRYAAAIAAFFVAFHPPAQAGPRAVDWDGLRRAVDRRPATVRLTSGATIEAREARFSGDAVKSYAVKSYAVSLDGRTVGCQEIESVTVRKKSRRALWMGLGAAAGAAAGLLLAKRFSNEGNDSAAALTVAGLAGAGVAFGALAGGQGLAARCSGAGLMRALNRAEPQAHAWGSASDRAPGTEPQPPRLRLNRQPSTGSCRACTARRR